MANEVFVIYGCPYTAFETTRDVNAFVVPEPDRSLYHLKRNTNRLLNLVVFSGVKKVKMVGCSPEFIAEFSALLEEHPEADIHWSAEGKTCTAFREQLVGDANASDVIVVERQPNLILIAYQLAREGGAKIVVVDPTSDEEAVTFSEAQKDFEEGDGFVRQKGLEFCCSVVKKKLGDGFFARPYSSATFITESPNNVYPFTYPTGHLPTRTAGELVVAGLLKTKIPHLQTGVAVVLDSGNTQANTASECNALREGLCCNYGVLPAHKTATLGDFKYFIEDLPVDLIFLTAHSGQMEVKVLEATFCYKGKPGRVRYAVDRGLSSIPKSGLVDCQTNYMPIEVNGISWKADDCDRGLFMKYSKIEMDITFEAKPANPEFENVVITSIADAGPTRFPAKCILCGDDQYFAPTTNTVGYGYFPLIFNNACSSFSGVCEEFIPEASFYVGTTRPIDSFSAVEVATQFVHNMRSMPLGKALFNAQRNFINSYTPYLFAGVPWLSMPRYESRAIAIMRANSLLKRLRSSVFGEPRTDHARRVFQEQQRKCLLKQLFDKRAATTAT